MAHCTLVNSTGCINMRNIFISHQEESSFDIGSGVPRNVGFLMQCCPGNFLMHSWHELGNVDAVKCNRF